MKAASSDAVFFGAPNKMPFAALHRLAVHQYCLRQCTLPKTFY